MSGETHILEVDLPFDADDAQIAWTFAHRALAALEPEDARRVVRAIVAFFDTPSAEAPR